MFISWVLELMDLTLHENHKKTLVPNKNLAIHSYTSYVTKIIQGTHKSHSAVALKVKCDYNGFKVRFIVGHACIILSYKTRCVCEAFSPLAAAVLKVTLTSYP